MRVYKSQRNRTEIARRSGNRLVRAVIETLERRTMMTATVTDLAVFNATDGSKPQAGLVADSSGNLYGTTLDGGTAGEGTVFELSASTQNITTLVTFNGAGNGSQPYAPLTFDSGGNLWGTTYSGGTDGDGTVFEITAGNHSFKTVGYFDATDDGANPQGGVVFDSQGNAYGTTYGGGAANKGTVWEITAGGSTPVSLVQFNSSNGTANGAAPVAGLVIDSSGNLYGTTQVGGQGNYGTVFELTAGNHGFVPLADFANSNGNEPFAPLTLYAGNLYGTTEYGGANSGGVVFEIPIAQESDQIEDLASFGQSNNPSGSGYSPLGPVTFDSSGDLFGTADQGGILPNGSTSGAHGSIFEIPNGGSLTSLTVFNGDDGAGPAGGLLTDSSGDLYGVTIGGGLQGTGASGTGTIYELGGGGFVAAPDITLTAAAGQPATKGVSQSFDIGRFAETNAVAPYTIAVNWGDGSGTTTETTSAAGAIAPILHTFGSAGTDTVSVTVTDSSGTPSVSNASTFPVTVTAPAAASTTQIVVHVFQETSQTGTSTGDPVAGREVYIDALNDGTFDVGDPYAVTDSSGNATLSLAGVTGTSWLVGQVLPAGTGQAYPAVTEQTVTQSNASSVTFRDFTTALTPTKQTTLYSDYQLPNLTSQADSSYITRSVYEPDGKLVVAGVNGTGAFVSRYFSDGEPDLGFGNGGTVVETNGTAGNTTGGLVVEPDGRIVLAVNDPAGGDAYAVRFNVNGTVDASFNWADFSGETVSGLTLMQNGSILVSGNAYNNSSGSQYVFLTDLADSSGVPANSFGSGGTATYGTALASGSTLVGPAVINPSGNIVVVTFDNQSTTSLVTISNNGESQTQAPLTPTNALSNFTPEAFTVQQTDGKVVVAGTSVGSSGFAFVLAVERVNPDGTPDNTFGSGGLITENESDAAPSENGQLTACAAEELGDGSILISGKYTGVDSSGNPDNQVFCQEYAASGSELFGYGGSNKLAIVTPVADGGAPLAVPSGVLPLSSASAAAGVASPSEKYTAVTGYIPTVMGDGHGVARIFTETETPSVAATMASTPTITAAVSTPETIQVEYKDSIALNLGTIGAGNILVKAPNGSTSTATYLGVEGGNLQDLTVDYQIGPVGGSTWTSAADGKYVIQLPGNQIENTDKFAPANSNLGSFAVNVSASTTSAVQSNLSTTSPSPRPELRP